MSENQDSENDKPLSMNLRKNTIEEIKDIFEKDYKISINEIEANNLGVSLLRLTKLALVVLARVSPEHELPMPKDN